MSESYAEVREDGAVRLAGTLAYPQATVTDVLTVQADGSIAAAAGVSNSLPYVWRMSLVTNNDPSSPQIMFTLTDDPETEILVGTAVSLPIAVTAGGQVTSGQRIYLPDELPTGGTLVCEGYEVAVSNADASEVLVASNGAPVPTLVGGENVFTDLSSAFGEGSDLSVSTANIVSAAGGSFLAQITGRFSYTLS